MKKALSRHKTNIPKIPNSKASNNKISLDLSIPGNKKILIKNKNDSIIKKQWKEVALMGKHYL